MELTELPFICCKWKTDNGKWKFVFLSRKKITIIKFLFQQTIPSMPAITLGFQQCNTMRPFS